MYKILEGNILTTNGVVRIFSPIFKGKRHTEERRKIFSYPKKYYPIKTNVFCENIDMAKSIIEEHKTLLKGNEDVGVVAIHDL